MLVCSGRLAARPTITITTTITIATRTKARLYATAAGMHVRQHDGIAVLQHEASR